MDLTLIILGILFLFLGFVGNFLPILPGPPLSYLALILIQISSKSFSTQFLITMAIVCVAITILDYMIPIIGTKKMGGTKRGVNGSTIGLIVGVIILPLMGIIIGPFGLIGLLAGPFIGAYIGEIAYQKHQKHESDNKKAFKSALGSFLGFISGVLVKITYTILVAIFLFPKIFEIIKDMF